MIKKLFFDIYIYIYIYIHITLTTMTKSMQGLRVKQTYEDLINVAVSDGLEHIKFPNRDASFLRWICSVAVRW